MLLLTRLSGPVFALNPDLIERAEATPDTVITLVNGTKYVICESLENLSRLVREYRAETAAAAYRLPMERRSMPPSGDHSHQGSKTSTNSAGSKAAIGTVVELRPGDL